MRKLRATSASLLALAAISGGAVMAAGSASAADGPSDYYAFQCTHDKDEYACEQETKLSQSNMSEDALKCLAGAGFAVGGLVVGDGIPDAIAVAVARKYVASAGAACLSSVVIGKI